MSYTMEDLWEAVRVLNPKQPIEIGENHILIMIIPGLIALEECKKLFTLAPTVEKQTALYTLKRAYWDVCQTGRFNLKDE